ncbi:MAG: plastocyanin/azurin family copper-binding protein, partial [Kiloniellales bacterium]
ARRLRCLAPRRDTLLTGGKNRPKAHWGEMGQYQGRLVLLAALLLGACGSSGPAYEAPGPDVAATVEMTSQPAFEPAEIMVKVGDKVAWRNTSDLLHTVTADPRITGDASNIELPEGARPFNSAAVAPGQVFRYTFTVPGTYRYLCLPHAGQGMFGTVVVEPES